MAAGACAWKKRQAERKKSDEDPTDLEPKLQRHTTTDATIEAASKILSEVVGEHGKLTIVSDELNSFLGGFGRYTPNGASARAQWLQSYDGGPERIDRINRGHVYVPNWSIVIAGNIQPRLLASMGKDLITDGLFQRFMTIHAKPAEIGVDDDQPLPLDVGRDYRNLHEALAGLMPARNAQGEFATAYFDDEARAVRRTFVPLIERLQVDPTLPTIIRETAPKWSGLLVRISLIFHLIGLAERQMEGEVLSGRDMCAVGGATVTMAATFIKRVLLPNLFRLGFESLQEEGAMSGHARWLAGFILAHQSERLTASEVGRAYRPLRGKPRDIDQALAVLCDAGWTAPTEARHDGARWNVNPAVHTRFAQAASEEKDRRAKALRAIQKSILEV